MGFRTFTPQGEAWDFEFPPDCGVAAPAVGLWQDCVSASPTCLHVGCPRSSVCRSCLASVWGLGFSQEIIPYVDSVCLWEKVSSGSFYVTILNWIILFCLRFNWWFFIVSSSSCLHYCRPFLSPPFGWFVQWYKFPPRLLNCYTRQLLINSISYCSK